MLRGSASPRQDLVPIIRHAAHVQRVSHALRLDALGQFGLLLLVDKARLKKRVGFFNDSVTLCLAVFPEKFLGVKPGV